MKLFNQLVKIILYTNIYISVAAAGFFYTGYLLLSAHYETPPFYYLSFVFLATMIIYNLHTISSYSVSSPLILTERQRWVRERYKMLLFLYYITFFFLLCNLFWLKWDELLFLAHLGIISTLYNIPENTIRLPVRPFRAIPLIKVFLIAYVWAAVGVLLPALILADSLLSARVLMLFFAHFLFIVAITLPFDIRDIYLDKNNQLLTFPGLLGDKLTKVLAILCLFCFTCILVFLKTELLIPLVILGIITSLLIIFANEKRSTFYYIGLIDGTIIIYFIFVIIFSVFAG